MHIDIVQRPLPSTLPASSAPLGGHQLWLADDTDVAASPTSAPRRAADAPPDFHLDLSAMNRIAPAAIRGPLRSTPLHDDEPPTMSVRASRLVIR